MAETLDGFLEFSTELEILSKTISDEEVKKKALDVGAKPIVDRANRIISSHRRTGTLEESIIGGYDSGEGVQRIGWGGKLNGTKSATGFYGRFLERGWHPVTGKRKNGKFINKKRTGKFIRIEHLMPAYEAEKENTANAMIAVYRDEIGG